MSPILKHPTAVRTPIAPFVSNPSQLEGPAFLMNVPFCLSADFPNNPWMEELLPEQRLIDRVKAMDQFLELYHFLSSDATIFLLPTPRKCDCQDLVYTANLGVVLEHYLDHNTVVISNFASTPRRGETEIGVQFFESMGYNVCLAPFKFEGEAELKHLHGNLYLGGYGIRSEPRAYDWMEVTHDMRVIRLHLRDPYLYHLDCAVFPLMLDQCMVCSELFTHQELAQIALHTDIVDVPMSACRAGICNTVRLGGTLVNASHIDELKEGTEEYLTERAKNRLLEEVASEQGFDIRFFNLSEFRKSGAMLSCLVMHLNRRSYLHAPV